MNGARTRVVGGQLAVNIIFENDNIVTLGEGQHRALAGIRHDKTLRVIAVRHQDNAFDRPLLQRQLQRFDTDPAVRIGRDLNGFDPQTAQQLHGAVIGRRFDGNDIAGLAHRQQGQRQGAMAAAGDH